MSHDFLLQRAKTLKLNGLVENWHDVANQPWVEQLLNWEEVICSFVMDCKVVAETFETNDINIMRHTRDCADFIFRPEYLNNHSETCFYIPDYSNTFNLHPVCTLKLVF